MSQAVLFDTHAFIKELKESGFEERQAEALSSAIKRVQKQPLEELATKQDILLLRGEIKASQSDLLVKLFGIIFGCSSLVVAVLKLIL